MSSKRITLADELLHVQNVQPVIYRYFRVSRGPLWKAFNCTREHNRKTMEAWQAAKKSFGFPASVEFHETGLSLQGFTRPATTAIKGGWDVNVGKTGRYDVLVPDKRTPEGKAAQKILNSLPQGVGPFNGFAEIGLERFCGVREGNRYLELGVHCWGYGSEYFYLAVPWRNYPPELLQQVEKAGKRSKLPNCQEVSFIRGFNPAKFDLDEISDLDFVRLTSPSSERAIKAKE